MKSFLLGPHMKIEFTAENSKNSQVHGHGNNEIDPPIQKVNIHSRTKIADTNDMNKQKFRDSALQ